MLTEDPHTLKGIVISRINGDLIDEPIVRGDDKTKTSFGIIIVDEFSARILSNYLTMTEVLNRGVFSVENIYQVRQRFQLYQGIYFISPTKKSCECIAKDFNDKKNPQYKKLHIFFTHKPSDECLQCLVNEGIINRTVTCSIFNLAFYTYSHNVFNLDLESGLKIYKCQDFLRDKLIEVIGLRLVTVLSNLKTKPIVQYQASSKLCTKLAEIMDRLIEELPIKTKREGILLLTDRTLDLATPLLHDYNYEVMTYDFFDVVNGKFKIGDKNIELKSTDELWESYRTLHIAQVFERLQKDVEAFQKSDISKAKDKANLDSFEGMTTALTGMNAYKQKSSQLSTQITIADEMNRLYKERSIYDMIELEQDIISGENNGKKINARDIFKNFTILKGKIQEQREDMLRILMILYVSLSIAEKDFKVLQGKMSDRELKVFDNMKEFFGIEENTKGTTEFKPRSSSSRERLMGNNSRIVEQMNYSSLRSSPKLEIIIEKASNYKLDLKEFPLYNWDEALPKIDKKKFGTKNLFSADTDIIDDEEDMQNLILFNIGGLGRNEIIALEKLTTNNVLNHKLTIGSTNIITAKEFIKQIQDLSDQKMEDYDRDCFEAYGRKDSILNVSNTAGSSDSFI